MKRILFLLAIVGLFTVACSKDNEGTENTNPTEQPGEEEKESQIELSKQKIDVDFESGNYSITVTSPYSWSATSDNDWIVVDSQTGFAGTETLSFKVKRNIVDKERKGVIIIKNSDRELYAELYIVQDALIPELEVTTTELNFSADGGSQIVEVKANFDYDITTTAEWFTYEKCENGICIVVSKNYNQSSLEAEIEVGSNEFDIEPKIISVKQEAGEPVDFEIGFGGGDSNSR